MTLIPEQLSKQLQFMKEIDRLKTIIRRTKLMTEDRYENSAEHSWHLAMMALTMHEQANESVNLLHVIKILLVHDIVEIDAGDTFAYDIAGHSDKEERELKAAHRIFGLLPDEQTNELKQLWLEYEMRETPEAKFACALDRIQPMIHNYHSEGQSWIKYGVTAAQVYSKNSVIEEGSKSLWQYAQFIIEDSIEKGYLQK